MPDDQPHGPDDPPQSESAAQSHTGSVSSAPRIPGWRHVYAGKVRDLYVPDETSTTTPSESDDCVLVVASDRISAYDFVLQPAIPDKGAILTALSLWWFEQLDDIVANHVISTQVPQQVAGRAMICKKLQMYPAECVARGYLAGSGWAEYQQSGSVCGVTLPTGLLEASELPEPIFTPATKAPQGDHDVNVPFSWMLTQFGDTIAHALRDLTLRVYTRAHGIAKERGILLADTKFEFGFDPARDAANPANIILADEVLTPDSSRFWPLDQYQPGGSQPSFDKQFVRDYLTSTESGWDRASDTPPTALPLQVVEKTRQRYIDAYERLTGSHW